jgi:SAM-dependent methyltransferase
MGHGEVWRRFDAMEARLTAPTSERMLELGGVREGQRVLDIATGRGEPAIRAAHRVGPTGSVLGIDVDASVLAMARERADAEGIANLELRVADLASAADAVATAAFDVALARWGLMFMASPVAAMTTIRRALVDDGVLVLAVWAEPERVPFMSLPRRVLSSWRALPPWDLDVPGIFYYADPERLRGDIEAAGLHVAHVEERETAVMKVDTEAELLAWVMTFAGVAPSVRALSDDERHAWEQALVRAVVDANADGAMRLGGVTRIVVCTPSHR